jgi:hypothetical protein
MALEFSCLFYAILCQIVIDPSQSLASLYRTHAAAGSV